MGVAVLFLNGNVGCFFIFYIFFHMFRYFIKLNNLQVKTDFISNQTIGKMIHFVKL